MGKKEQKSQEKICQYIYDDYIFNRDFSSSNDVFKNINLLIENNLATKISGTDDMSTMARSYYKLAGRFLCKYRKDLKKYKRKHLPGVYEDDYKIVGTDKRVLDLNDYALDDGVYYIDLSKGDNDDYAIFKVDQDESSRYSVKYELYFIGYRHLKFKDKFFKLVDKFKEIDDKDRFDAIFYSDGRPMKTDIFKPFENMVFNKKDKILKYIDNWVDNIPKYYKYGMIPKLSILLYGEPGTGKSTFCKALAKYLDIESCTIVSPDYFMQSESSSGRGRRSLKSYMPTVYSIDDIDCICESREDNKSQENTTALSSLLEFLDNPDSFYFKAKDGLYYPISIVVASTNYIDKLDPAVKRYGRFDLKVEMNAFNREEAEEMCKLYDLTLSDVYNKPIKKDFSITPAYLQALCLENIDSALKAVN